MGVHDIGVRHFSPTWVSTQIGVRHFLRDDEMGVKRHRCQTPNHVLSEVGLKCQTPTLGGPQDWLGVRDHRQNGCQ